eukprot:TRINITY_DN7105_c0_g1_i2.p2 TRINITY_DN7105_c0_g1~~TRINITY_DN7105_c0_g1_i2.p2  ORF type:complete len:131 (+),score=52.03 TRINITY_DN7105_c0_g1_i2:104-496(+)
MKSGIFVGLNKGFIVQKPTSGKKRVRPAYRKGRLGSAQVTVGKRTKQVREIVREMAGSSHYERRITEMLKVGTGASGKKALKIAKKRLGTMRRAKAKRNELETLMQAMKHVTEHKDDKEHKTHKKEDKKP